MTPYPSPGNCVKKGIEGRKGCAKINFFGQIFGRVISDGTSLAICLAREGVDLLLFRGHVLLER